MAELVMIFTAVSNAEIEVLNPVRALQSLALTNGSNIEKVTVEADPRLDKDDQVLGRARLCISEWRRIRFACGNRSGRWQRLANRK